ncbi:hypothetical protein Pcinc_005352 [Petrolisthes cinctipes]|uniref:Dynein regulatory complex protein 1 n=1 Tax=Petrolisthes cinctipes TaxID=88211 RepID=A0AAE1GFB7_PETCI|nr:hypothetical protein Pcinc_005352 [Petrolisthes cinctipes]
MWVQLTERRQGWFGHGRLAMPLHLPYTNMNNPYTLSSNMDVGNVEVAAVSGEVVAVVESEARREAWREALQKDAQGTQEALDKIHQYWEEAVSHTIPEDLHSSLCQLREWSEELREEKLSVVEGLRAELCTLDLNYGTQLLQQARQRAELLRRTTEHVTELHQAYRVSLTKVQDVVDEERGALVKYYEEVWEEAVASLNQQLHTLLHQRLHNRTSHIDQIIELKLHGAAEHTAVKDQLDADIEKVVVEVMRMKAAQQVEESQLRYSHQVLQQQLKETTAMVSEARRALNTLTPTLNSYRRKAEAAEENQAAREQARVREAARLKEVREQYRQRLSQISSWYMQQARRLALMHYNTLHSLIMQVVEVERAIRQGVLAQEWVEPDLHCLADLRPPPDPRHTPALTAATRILQSSLGSLVLTKEKSDFDDGEERESSEREEVQVGGTRVDVEFLSRLAEEAVFLLNTDTGHVTESGPLLLLEHIFWELGVHTEADVLQLLHHARRQVTQQQSISPTRSLEGRGGEETDDAEDNEEVDGEADVATYKEVGGEVEANGSEDRRHESAARFTTEDVLNVVITFCSARTCPSSGHAKAVEGESNEPMYTQEGEEALRWTSFLDQFCKRTRAWVAIKEAMTQYRDVLAGRIEETQKVERLRRENAELRFLLKDVAGTL